MLATLRREIFLRVLRPLILRNYRLRRAGLRPDRWYWADLLAMRWGFARDIWDDI
jgi:hypothetical protein